MIAAPLKLGLVLAALAAQPAAALDQAFVKPPDEKSWGQQILDYFAAPEFLSRKSFALVIGISHYDQLPSLPTAEDPVRMKDFLLHEAGFDYVHMLTEEDVTPARVQELMLEDFPRRVGPDDRMVFYWSGHGHTVKNRLGQFSGYLPTAAAGPDQFSRMISMDRLAEWDSYIAAKQVLYLLDSCFSGFAGARPKSLGNHVTLSQMDRPSRHIITAGTYEQETIATERLQGSIFTHAVLEGLRGSADSTSAFAPDGLVTVNELEDYVKKRVEILTREARWTKPITPQVWDLGMNEGEFFFVAARLKRDKLVDLGGSFEGFANGVPKSSNGISVEAVPPGATDATTSPDLVWAKAVLESDAAGLESYVARYPDGEQADLAREALRGLRREAGDDAAETDVLFWRSIRDSVLDAEFALYLDLFPDGDYRDLAEARLEALRRAAETTDFILGDEPFSTHARLRREALDKAGKLPLKFVQYGLIALGYPIPDPAGVLDSATRRAMRSYQASVGAEQTGRLSPWQTVDVVLKAAQIGDEHAETATGIMMAHGMGLQKNEAIARYWLERAAAKGNGYAQANLAILFRDGLGGAQDIDRARDLLERAKEQQVPGVGKLLETLQG